MTQRSRVKTLLRVAAIRKKQAQADLARAEAERQAALARQQSTADALAEAVNLPSGTVSSLAQHRQRTDLRIDAVLDAKAVATASAEQVEAARIRWQSAARNEKSMEELDRRERAVLAIRAARVAEKATDDALRSRRRPHPSGGQPT
ncbi:MAG: hypothetical protein IT196_17760 [Acidimicrobiales bacterium]|nr:hypothetical protein [Acidimicrobiales bacterium]